MKTPRIVAIVLFVLLGVFAAHVVFRGAYLQRPMTDAQIFFRGAWAVWSGNSLSDVTDDNGWNYYYPPTLAVLLRPMANAPEGQPPLPWTLTYPVSLLTWFALGLAALASALVLMARAVDGAFLNTQRIEGRARTDRLLWFGSLAAFLPIVGSGLNRGQVSTLLLLSVVGFTVAYARQRPVIAGLWLSMGITIKLFPAILAIVPLLRRDRRCLAAVVAGSFFGLIVIPAALLGPADAWDIYRGWLTSFVGITAYGAVDPQLWGFSPLHADMVGFGPVVLRLANLVSDVQRPLQTFWTLSAHWSLSVLLLALVLWAAYGNAWTWRPPQPSGPRSLVFFSALIASACIPMMTAAQVHYWTLAMPLHMCLIADQRRTAGGMYMRGWMLFGVSLWIGFILTDLRIQNGISSIGWLTGLLAGMTVYGAIRLRRAAGAPHPSGLC